VLKILEPPTQECGFHRVELSERVSRGLSSLLDSPSAAVLTTYREDSTASASAGYDP